MPITLYHDRVYYLCTLDNLKKLYNQDLEGINVYYGKNDESRLLNDLKRFDLSKYFLVEMVPRKDVAPRHLPQSPLVTRKKTEINSEDADIKRLILFYDPGVEESKKKGGMKYPYKSEWTKLEKDKPIDENLIFAETEKIVLPDSALYIAPFPPNTSEYRDHTLNFTQIELPEPPSMLTERENFKNNPSTQLNIIRNLFQELNNAVKNGRNFMLLHNKMNEMDEKIKMMIETLKKLSSKNAPSTSTVFYITILRDALKKLPSLAKQAKEYNDALISAENNQMIKSPNTSASTARIYNNIIKQLLVVSNLFSNIFNVLNEKDSSPIIDKLIEEFTEIEKKLNDGKNNSLFNGVYTYYANDITEKLRQLMWLANDWVPKNNGFIDVLYNISQKLSENDWESFQLGLTNTSPIAAKNNFERFVNGVNAITKLVSTLNKLVNSASSPNINKSPTPFSLRVVTLKQKRKHQEFSPPSSSPTEEKPNTTSPNMNDPFKRQKL